ncbi:MAG: FadR/GntR family transcriptional regulator [Spirochaetales bacterium]|nr:FadR/GntR family transcriptional regulator [Spirochaetales bacterium]
MKEIEPLKKVKVSDEVVQALESIIVENDLQPGDKLPSQAELSEKLQVGTRSIREAIRTLESRGLVETQQGKGVFVKEINLDYFLETLMGSFVFHFSSTKDLLVDLTKTRRIIESQAIYDIAADPPRGFVPRFAELVEKLDGKAEEQDIDSYNILDFELHNLIVTATGNKILITLYKHLHSLMMHSFNKTGYVRGSLDTSVEDHHRMLEALVAKDAKGARKIMEKHISLTMHKVEHLSSV